MGTFKETGKIAAVAALLAAALLQPARAEEPWQASFEQTCSGSGEAMTLTVDELRSLLETCGALEKVIEKQEATVRKVYLKRLKLCRNLYAYMLDYKTGAQSAK